MSNLIDSGRSLVILAVALLATACGSVPGQLGLGDSADPEECRAAIEMLLEPIAVSEARATALVTTLDQTLGDADERFVDLSGDTRPGVSDDPIADVSDTVDVVNAVNQRSLEGCGVPVLAAIDHVSRTNQLCDTSLECDEPPHVAAELPCFAASATVIDLGALGEDGLAIARYQPVDCETGQVVELSVAGTWVAPTSTEDWLALDSVYGATQDIPTGTDVDDALRNGWIGPTMVDPDDRPDRAIVSTYEISGGSTRRDIAAGEIIVISDFTWP